MESQRIRTAKSQVNTHQDHIADRGQGSMSHYNMANKPIAILKEDYIPAAKVATDIDWV